jgi:phospholipid-binding lipoprotein MlaA
MKIHQVLTLVKIDKPARWAIASLAIALVAGCATGPNANPVDPLEPVNRLVFAFNEKSDEAVFAPIAAAYVDLLPSIMRIGISNFFTNIGDVWNLFNNAAQFKLQNSAETLMRLNVNTFFGLGGILDIATEAGLDRHPEDFGQTLARWGVSPGVYIVLPLLGPSTVRDAASVPIDFWGDPMSHVNDVAWRNSLKALTVVDKRSQYLRSARLLHDAALDKYSFVRDAALQRRNSLVHDGRAPEEEVSK